MQSEGFGDSRAAQVKLIDELVHTLFSWLLKQFLHFCDGPAETVIVALAASLHVLDDVAVEVFYLLAPYFECVVVGFPSQLHPQVVGQCLQEVPLRNVFGLHPAAELHVGLVGYYLPQQVRLGAATQYRV